MFDDFSISGNESAIAEVNMAPLIDMVFILLIFFVVTTNFNRQTGIDVNKPKAQSAMTQGPKTILVGVSREGTIHVYGRQVTPQRLEMVIHQEVMKNPETSIVIIADQDAAIGKAVQVMDHCALAGAAKVSIAAQKE